MQPILSRVSIQLHSRSVSIFDQIPEKISTHLQIHNSPGSRDSRLSACGSTSLGRSGGSSGGTAIENFPRCFSELKHSPASRLLSTTHSRCGYGTQGPRFVNTPGDFLGSDGFPRSIWFNWLHLSVTFGDDKVHCVLPGWVLWVSEPQADYSQYSEQL